jgi:ATP-dependent RNA helicase DeaD
MGDERIRRLEGTDVPEDLLRDATHGVHDLPRPADEIARIAQRGSTRMEGGTGGGSGDDGGGHEGSPGQGGDAPDHGDDGGGGHDGGDDGGHEGSGGGPRERLTALAHDADLEAVQAPVQSLDLGDDLAAGKAHGLRQE